MKLSISLLLPLVGASYAVDTAQVYLFSNSVHKSKDTPVLSSIEAGLVFAQRLGVSQYHKLHEASKDAIRYVNNFGLSHQPLFAEEAESTPHQLVILAEGWSKSIEQEFSNVFDSMKPMFQITDSASEKANKKLIEDVSSQLSSSKPETCTLGDAINPYSSCWNGPNKALHVDFKNVKVKDEFLKLKDIIQRYTASEALELIFVAMPESSRASGSKKLPYGSYSMPAKTRSRRAEKPLASMDSAVQHETVSTPLQPYAGNTTILKGIIPFCHASMDACVSATNNCSSHGSCFAKYTGKEGSCFACGCVPDLHVDGKKVKKIYWGGAACQKHDISSQFWLIASFAVILAGLVSWAIGMLFSIGEEKLPGVIGAGVSGPKNSRS